MESVPEVLIEAVVFGVLQLAAFAGEAFDAVVVGPVDRAAAAIAVADQARGGAQRAGSVAVLATVSGAVRPGVIAAAGDAVHRSALAGFLHGVLRSGRVPPAETIPDGRRCHGA